MPTRRSSRLQNKPQALFAGLDEEKEGAVEECKVSQENLDGEEEEDEKDEDFVDEEEEEKEEFDKKDLEEDLIPEERESRKRSAGKAGRNPKHAKIMKLEDIQNWRVVSNFTWKRSLTFNHKGKFQLLNPLHSPGKFWPDGTYPKELLAHDLENIEKSNKKKDGVQDEDYDEEESDDYGLRITVTRAKSEYGLREEHFWDLDCLKKRNPNYRSAAPMRLYLISEVASKARQVHRQRKRERLAKVKTALDERVFKLSRKGISLNALAPQFREAVFEDYLDAKQKPLRGLSAVNKYWKSSIRVQCFLAPKFWKKSMLWVFMNAKDNDLMKGFPASVYKEIVYAFDKSSEISKAFESCFHIIAKFLHEWERDVVKNLYEGSAFVRKLKRAEAAGELDMVKNRKKYD